MLTDTELAALRSDQQDWMLDTVTVRRAGAGGMTYNPSTGNYDPAAASIIYSGPGRVMPLGGESVDQFGGQHLTTGRYRVTLPYNAGDLAVEDQVTVDASNDDQLAGRTLRVVDVTYSAIQTARRLIAVDDLG